MFAEHEKSYKARTGFKGETACSDEAFQNPPAAAAKGRLFTQVHSLATAGIGDQSTAPLLWQKLLILVRLLKH
jgi:hypothetical protein